MITLPLVVFEGRARQPARNVQIYLAMARQLPKVVRFFDAPGPNPWVVRLALAAKGVDLPAVTRKMGLVDGRPENRSDAMLALNSAGTTPFVQLEDGSVLAESVAIVSYLDHAYPGAGPRLMGGDDALQAAQVLMWQRRVELQIIMPWQRQFQNGEGAPYFSQFVPWVAESVPSVPGLRCQVRASLAWLEDEMQARVQSGKDTGFVAGTPDFTVADLQLYTTAEFMGGPKVNRAKLTEPFDPRQEESFGPWLHAWLSRMAKISRELTGPSK